MKQVLLGMMIVLSFLAAGAAAQTAAEQQFDKGVRLAAGGKYAQALPAFEAALRFAAGDEAADEFRARVHFNIGVCLYRTGRSADAVGALETSLRLKKDYEKAFYALGMAETDLRRWRAAEAAFRAALALNPRNGEAWLDLAFVHLAENYAAAAVAFRRAIAHESVDAHLAHNNLGVILALEGDLAAAVGEFETAVRRSKGRLAVAGRNLQFCRQMGQNPSRDLVARLEFSEF